MKYEEYRRLRESILDSIGVSSLKKIEKVCHYKNIKYDEVIDKFIVNISKFVFYQLYNHNRLTMLVNINKLLRNEYNDYIAKYFILGLYIQTDFNKKRGVEFHTLIGLNRELDDEYADVIEFEKELNKRMDYYQKQQFKWAARQGRRKK